MSKQQSIFEVFAGFHQFYVLDGGIKPLPQVAGLHGRYRVSNCESLTCLLLRQ